MIKFILSILVLIANLITDLLSVLSLLSSLLRIPLMIGLFEIFRRFWRNKKANHNAAYKRSLAIYLTS